MPPVSGNVVVGGNTIHIGCLNGGSYMTDAMGNPTEHGCLLISGELDSSGNQATTLVTTSEAPDIVAGNANICCVAHLEVENLTFTRNLESVIAGQIGQVGSVAAGTVTVNAAPAVVACSGVATGGSSSTPAPCASVTMSTMSNNATGNGGSLVLVQNHNSFASLIAPSAADASGYMDGDSVEVEVGAGSACARNPKLNLSVSQGTVAITVNGTSPPAAPVLEPNELLGSNSSSVTGTNAHGATITTTTFTYTAYTVRSVVDFGGCTSLPNNGLPIQTPDLVRGGSTMAAYIAPTPSPLSQYNEMVNTGGSNYIRAYAAPSASSTLGLNLAPSLTNSLTCTGFGAFHACAVTGCPESLSKASSATFCDNEQIPVNYTENVNGYPGIYYHPALTASVSQNGGTVQTWNILTDREINLSNSATAYDYMPFYVTNTGAATGNIACMKVDADQAVSIANPGNGYTEDVVLNNLVFINHSRMEFSGILGANSTIAPTADLNTPSYQQKITNPSSAQGTFDPYAGFVPNQGVQIVNVTVQGSDLTTNCAQTSGGGAQISGVAEPKADINPNTNAHYGKGPVWGNFIYNYKARSTADDSLANFNDIGGQTVTLTTTSSGATSSPPPITYPQTVIDGDSQADALISNSYVRFILFQSSSDDISHAICSANSTSATISTVANAFGTQICSGIAGTATGTNTLSWGQASAGISTTIWGTSAATSAIQGCDPLALHSSDNGTVTGSGCPITYIIDTPKNLTTQSQPQDGVITTTLPSDQN